jgi:hypothetical protein
LRPIPKVIKFVDLALELLQPPHLGRQQAVVLLLPIEVGRLADLALSANLGHRNAVRSLLEMNAFWASENFDAFIVRSSPVEEV